MTNSPCDFAPLRSLRHAKLDLHLRTLASDQGYNPDHSFALNTYSTVLCSTSSSEMSTHMLPHASPPATTSESYLCPQCSPSQQVPRLQRAPSSRSCTIFPPFFPDATHQPEYFASSLHAKPFTLLHHFGAIHPIRWHDPASTYRSPDYHPPMPKHVACRHTSNPLTAVPAFSPPSILYKAHSSCLTIPATTTARFARPLSSWT
jgi:hypothetical protein